MNVSDELLDKYFKNQCTPEEKLLVVNYLNGIDSFPDHLVTKTDWDDAQDIQLSDEKSNRLFDAIKKQTFAKPIKLKWLKITAAAAIVLAFFTIGFLKLQEKQPGTIVAKTSVKKPNVINWKSMVNYTEKPQLITLPDQSIVKIYPGGELRYALPFVQANREIYLKGKGFFQVTKDKKHPFVVYAKGISTTALGTSFTITASDNSKYIKVQLHTGKVWVKNIVLTNHMLAFSKILLPGNELVYNTASNEIKMVTPKTLLAKTDVKLELNFTQAPLTDVFSKLEEHYKIKITYNPADLQEMSFTGTLKLALPIKEILKEITELNKLNQIQTPSGYEITK